MRSSVIRIFVYLFSLVLLALGLTLNVQTGLGVSPIVSVAFSASAVTGIAFADATFILYSLFVVVEVIVHMTVRKKERIEVVKDLLQLPLSLVFTRFMALLQIIIPDVSGENMATTLNLFSSRTSRRCLSPIIPVWLENMAMRLFFRIGKYSSVCSSPMMTSVF